MYIPAANAVISAYESREGSEDQIIEGFKALIAETFPDTAVGRFKLAAYVDYSIKAFVIPLDDLGLTLRQIDKVCLGSVQRALEDEGIYVKMIDKRDNRVSLTIPFQ